MSDQTPEWWADVLTKISGVKHTVSKDPTLPQPPDPATKPSQQGQQAND